VAPFLRGYAPTQVPADGRYQIGALVRDVNALHEALGGNGDAVIVGHDWGALATYGAVAHQPDRWHRAVTAGVPPTASIGMSLFTYAQLRKSWYMFFFLSSLAEVALPLDDYSFIDQLWRDWSPGYDGTWDVARVKESIGDPERIAAAIGYYRLLAQDPACGEETRFELAATGLKESTHDVSADNRSNDPSLNQFARLLQNPAFDLAGHIAKAKWLDVADLFYLGFHFAEQTHRARELGRQVLELVVKRSPQSELGKQAKRKLKSEGLA